MDTYSGGVQTYKNDRGIVTKDEVIDKLIPGELSECAIHLQKKSGDVCMSDKTVEDISKIISVHGGKTFVINEAKRKLDCGTERCVLSKLSDKLGHSRVKHEIDINLKVVGPTDTKLLSNVNIDVTLKQWATKFKDFFPYNFNMINYASYSWSKGYVVESPDTLSTINFADLYAKGVRCCACVINTDTYQGAGKHWMALFADARNPAKCTVEFFNSSANNPAPEWVSWMVKTKSQLETVVPGSTVEVIKVCDIRHQQSRTECGLYSLFYIWARLNGIPPEYFMKNTIPDQLMFEFRHCLFDNPECKQIKRFDWNEYKNTFKILWE